MLHLNLAIAGAQTPLYYKVPNRRVCQLVGREDILQRLDKAFSAGSGPRLAVLQGMGGQGKSQIALEYCHRKKATLYSATFWVDATTVESTKGSFWAISEEIKRPAHVLHDTEARVNFVLRELSSWSIQWLLVFDNYDNLDAFPNITDFIPQNDLGAILVTSRHADSDALVLGQSNHFIKLHGLEEDAAILLLTQRSQTKDFESKDAKEIVARLAYHPLAITQAGAYIKKVGLRLSDFMKHYKEKREKILKNTPPLSEYRKKLGNNEEETSLNVFTTWELSFQQLESKASESNSKVKLLTLFAFFDNKDISEQLFAEFEANEKAKSTSAELLTWLNAFTDGTSGEWSSDSFADVLITLRDLSLLQGFAQEPNGYYHLSLHPLIKDWIQLRTSKLVGQENIYMAATLVNEMLLGSWRNEHFELPLSFKQSILLHIIALEEAHEEFFGLQVEIVANQDIFNEFLTSQFWFAKFLSSSGLYQLAVIIFQQVVAQEEECLGPEHPDTLTSTDHLASTYHKQGRWGEAEELEVQVMETRKRVLGLEHPDTLTSTDHLASTYHKQGRWGEAEELEVQVMETRKRVLGLENTDTLTSSSNLALMYWNQGRWKETEELGLQVMETRKRVLGLEHPDTLASMGILALTYWDQGRWGEAEELEVQVMETMKRVLGLEHPETLTSVNNLASTYHKQGRWGEAEELDLQVMETSKRVLGLEHPDTLISMDNLALTYQSQGRWKEAEELGAQVMETSKRVLGFEHPDTLISSSNLALTYWDQGRWKEAEELGAQVMETSKRVLGFEHPDTLISSSNLALTYWDQGRWKEAEELNVQVMETRKRVLGLEHPGTLASSSNLALIYQKQGRWKEAEELGAQVMETSKRVLGFEHPSTLISSSNLAFTFWDQDERDQAIQLMTEVIRSRRQNIGPEHPDTILSIRALQKWQSRSTRWHDRIFKKFK